MHFHVVAEDYRTSGTVELTVSKNALSLSGEGFTITDADGNVAFRMDGHALSIRDRCTLLDHHHHPILTARKKLLTMHERWEVCKGNHFNENDLLFTVKKSSMLQFRTHLYVFLRGNESEHAPDFEVKGNFFERQAHILHGEQVIAEVKRKFTVGNVLLDKHTFTIVVSPHVDQAFIAALVIIMDLIHDD